MLCTQTLYSQMCCTLTRYILTLYTLALYTLTLYNLTHCTLMLHTLTLYTFPLNMFFLVPLAIASESFARRFPVPPWRYKLARAADRRVGDFNAQDLANTA